MSNTNENVIDQEFDWEWFWDKLAINTFFAKIKCLKNFYNKNHLKWFLNNYLVDDCSKKKILVDYLVVFFFFCYIIFYQKVIKALFFCIQIISDFP